MKLEANQISIHEILETVFRNKWLFLLCSVLGLLGALVFVDHTDKYYYSKADIQVIDKNASEPLLKGLGVTTSMHQRFNTVRARMVSLGYLEEMARSLQEENKRNMALHPGSRDWLPFLGGQPVEKAAENVKNSLSMGVTNGIIFIRCERKDPYEAQHIVRRLTSQVQESLRGFSEIRLGEAIEVLKGLVDQYSDKLTYAEEVLRDFEVYNQVDLAGNDMPAPSDLTDLEASTESPKGIVLRFVSLLDRHSTNEVNLQALRAKYAVLVEDLNKEPEYLITHYTSERSRVAMELEGLLAKGTGELEQLRQGRTEDHPLVIEKREEVEQYARGMGEWDNPVTSLQEQSVNPVIADIKKESSRLRAEIQSLERQQDRLLDQITDMKEKVKQIPGKELAKTRLKREMGIQAGLYSSIRVRYEQALLTHELEKKDRGVVFQELGQASLNLKPIRPRETFIYGKPLAISGYYA